MFDDPLAQIRELFHDLAHKSDYIHGRGVGRLAQKLHERVYDRRSDVRKFDGTDMNALDEELAIFHVLYRKTPSAPLFLGWTHGKYKVHLLVLCLECSRQLLPQESDDLLNIFPCDHVQRNSHGLSPYLHVGAGRKHPEDVHGKIVEDMLVLRAEGVDSIQDNDLDIVV